MADPLPVSKTLHLPCACLISFLLVLFQAGCTDQIRRENQQVRDEIIIVHDRAMEKIGLMFELETRLQRTTHNAELSETTVAVAALQAANRAMFDWMHQYQTLAIADDLEKDTAYRHAQLQLIKKVEHLTEQAIARAEDILATRQSRRMPEESGQGQD